MARCDCGSTSGAGRGEVDSRDRGRRRGRLASGAEHPRAGRRRFPPSPRRISSCSPRRVDRRRHGRALLRALARRHRIGARSHAPAADREDREAAGGGARRGDHQRGRLRDGRARRSRHRAADRAGAARAEAAARARGLGGTPVDHGDADARLDGQLLAPDPRRGHRRRQRDPRRHRRGHALPGDGGRSLPGGGGRDDGGGRRAGRVDRPLRALERVARAAHRIRPGLHDRPQPLRRRARAAPRRAGRPDAVRAAPRAWSPRIARRCRSTRCRPAKRRSGAAG